MLNKEARERLRDLLPISMVATKPSILDSISPSGILILSTGCRCLLWTGYETSTSPVQPVAISGRRTSSVPLAGWFHTAPVIQLPVLFKHVVKRGLRRQVKSLIG
jgi:hypothetical protein